MYLACWTDVHFIDREDREHSLHFAVTDLEALWLFELYAHALINREMKENHPVVIDRLGHFAVGDLSSPSNIG